MVCIVVAWTLGAFFAVAFQCGSDISNLWSSAANVAHQCTSGAAVGIGFSIPDVITDGLILAMPLYWVSGFFQDVGQYAYVRQTWKLQMSFWRKMSVSGIFLFGAM